MHVRTVRRVATSVATGALALLGTAPAALAADRVDHATATVTVDRLVLAPTARGYRSDLPFRVTNTSADPQAFHLHILEPVAGSFRDLGPDSACLAENDLVDGRRVWDCTVPGLYLQPGAGIDLAASFEVLTAVRPYAMRTDSGRIEAVAANQARAAGAANVATVFRAADGSLQRPQWYTPDTQARASVTASDVTLTRRTDGRWTGRATVTVRYAGDAAHDYLWVKTTGLPEGVGIFGTDPEGNPGSDTQVDVPGGRFMAGEERTFAIIFTGDAAIPAGDLGTVPFEVGTTWWPNVVPDADPSDNAVPVRFTAVG